jgi:transposase
MISPPAGGVRIMVSSRPVDFRNGLDGLAAMVQQALHENPFAGDIFVFRSKRADRVKILYWDGTGLCLLHKRLEQGRFAWPCRRGDSPQCRPIGTVAGGSGVVAGAAKASNCANGGGLTERFCWITDDRGKITICCPAPP